MILEHNTLHKIHIDIPHHRLAKSSNSFQITFVKYINRLLEFAFLYDNNSLKTKLSNWLLDNPFYSIKEILDCNIEIEMYLYVYFFYCLVLFNLIIMIFV